MPLSINRLQLGTSRLERMSPSALSVFLDDSWLHLGESEPLEVTHLERFRNHVARAGLRTAVFQLPRAVIRRARRSPPAPAPDVSGTSFEPFHFGLDSPLRAPDRSFDFVFAEHFIEHLFLDEALFSLTRCSGCSVPVESSEWCVPTPTFAGTVRLNQLDIPQRRCVGTMLTSTKAAGRSGRCPRSCAERASSLTPCASTP